MPEETPTTVLLTHFASVTDEVRRRTAEQPARSVTFPWLSDTDTERMVLRFRRLAAELALAPLGEARVVDESAQYPDAGRRDFVLLNDRGAALYEQSYWVGGSPGDALLQRFVLLLEDGASIDVSVVDSCTQDAIEFSLRGGSAASLAQIARALEETLEAMPAVAPDWLRR